MPPQNRSNKLSRRSPHSPSGYCVPVSVRGELFSWCEDAPAAWAMKRARATEDVTRVRRQLAELLDDRLATNALLDTILERVPVATVDEVCRASRERLVAPRGRTDSSWQHRLPAGVWSALMNYVAGCTRRAAATVSRSWRRHAQTADIEVVDCTWIRPCAARDDPLQYASSPVVARW
jgi:hypothetical protein